MRLWRIANCANEFAALICAHSRRTRAKKGRVWTEPVSERGAQSIKQQIRQCTLAGLPRSGADWPLELSFNLARDSSLCQRKAPLKIGALRCVAFISCWRRASREWRARKHKVDIWSEFVDLRVELVCLFVRLAKEFRLCSQNVLHFARLISAKLEPAKAPQTDCKKDRQID